MTAPAATARDRLRPVLWVALAVGAAAAAAALAGATAALPVGVVVARAGADAAGVACVGLTLVAVLLPGPTGATRRDLARIGRRLDRSLLVLAGGWVVLVLLGVTFRAADAFGRPLGQLGGGEVLAWSTRLAAGRGLVLTAGCAVVVLVCAAVRLRDPDRVAARFPLVAALLGVLTPTITGHAGSAPNHQVAVVTAALHAGAAALWVGGLAGLLVLVAAHRPLLDATIGRFSQLAGVCVATVALTGVLGAQVRLESWAALFGTGYGLLVVAKTVALLGLAGLGALARRRLAAGRTPVLRWAGIEVALMAVTLGLAAALSQVAP